MNCRDIYNNKLDKLKKTYQTEMQNENAHFKNYKVKPKTKTTEIQKTCTLALLKRKIPSV